jgi:hypothetical protein
VVITLRRASPILFRIKLPRPPSDLGIENPFPRLTDSWDPRSKEWSWEIPEPAQLPDVGIAIDIARDHQPTGGPMRAVSPGN